jgi:hypothetical protein
MKNKTYKELNDKEQQMVYVLALGLAANKRIPKEDRVAYTSKDVCEQFNLSTKSYAAVQANITRSI